MPTPMLWQHPSFWKHHLCLLIYHLALSKLFAVTVFAIAMISVINNVQVAIKTKVV
jgi:hypothetical protein